MVTTRLGGSNAAQAPPARQRPCATEPTRAESLPAWAPVATSALTGARTRALALDDVVDLEHLGLTLELDPNVVQHRLQSLTERVELLARIPDLADAQVALRAESDVVGEALRRPVAGLLEAADAFIVLLRRHSRRGREAGKDARLAIAHRRGRRLHVGGH